MGKTLLCSLSLLGDHSCNGHTTSVWGFPVLSTHLQPIPGCWEQEEHCFPWVFRSRDLHEEEEQEEGKWLLQCLRLLLLCPPKRRSWDLISLRQLSKNLPGIQRKRPLYFPPTDLAAKPASRSTRGKNPILLVRAHYCQTDRPTWARAGSRSETGRE